jgi:hypothetical protein
LIDDKNKKQIKKIPVLFSCPGLKVVVDVEVDDIV